jgi:hypothetical protein
LDPLHRDAEQERSVGVLGARAHGDADVRVPEERRERSDEKRDRHHRDDVVAAEDRSSDREAEVEGRREALRRRIDVESPGKQDAAGGEQQRQADRHDGQDETWRLEEATDEKELDGDAEHDSGRDPDGQREEVRQTRPDDQQNGEARGHTAEVSLREVHDAVRAIDQRDAERDERGESADHHPLHEHAERRRPKDLLEEVEEQDQCGIAEDASDAWIAGETVERVRHAPRSRRRIPDVDVVCPHRLPSGRDLTMGSSP